MRIVATVCLLSVCACATAATITIRADEWFPYNGDPTAVRPGYMIDAARLIAKRNGHEISYSQLTWEEAVAAARAGTIDCVVGALKGDAPDFRFPDHAWGLSNEAFFVLADDPWIYRQSSDLIGRRVSRIAGYEYTAEVENFFESAPSDRIVLIENTRSGLSKAMMLLVTKRVDVVVDDENVGLAKLGEMNLHGRVKMAGRGSTEEDIYIACTPARPAGAVYAKMFGDGIIALRRSGELANILKRYGLRDWTEPH